ncbi:MAG: hypothetical protein Kow00123_03810 [Anaerolineales bacterium]
MLTQLKKKEVLVAGAAGLIVGLLLGWLVIGWWLWPVKWVDADPWDLRAEHKQAYVAMVADSLATNGDSGLAQQRLQNWDRKELASILQSLIEDRRARQMGLEAQNLEMLRQALGLEAAAAPAPAPAPQPAAKGASGLVRWLPVILGVLVLLLIALAAIGSLTRKQKQAGSRRGPAPSAPAAPAPEGTIRLNGNVATYRFGEATYDESFSIESPEGEFLGECGMGISETLAEGTPNRVTALEIWLFDKTDIRTVTKVLMSEWAHGDAEMRAALAPKGELLLAQPGAEFTLETERLRLKATLTEVAYGSEQPANSYFERLVVRMEPFLKQAPAPTAR